MWKGSKERSINFYIVIYKYAKPKVRVGETNQRDLVWAGKRKTVVNDIAHSIVVRKASKSNEWTARTSKPCFASTTTTRVRSSRQLQASSNSEARRFGWPQRRSPWSRRWWFPPFASSRNYQVRSSIFYFLPLNHASHVFFSCSCLPFYFLFAFWVSSGNDDKWNRSYYLTLIN